MATKSEILAAKAAKYAKLAAQEKKKEKEAERKRRTRRLIQLGGTIESVLKQVDMDAQQVDVGLLAGLIDTYKELFILTEDGLGVDALELKQSGDAYLRAKAAEKQRQDEAAAAPLLEDLANE